MGAHRFGAVAVSLSSLPPRANQKTRQIRCDDDQPAITRPRGIHCTMRRHCAKSLAYRGADIAKVFICYDTTD
jgi:hypothetical protein